MSSFVVWLSVVLHTRFSNHAFASDAPNAPRVAGKMPYLLRLNRLFYQTTPESSSRHSVPEPLQEVSSYVTELYVGSPRPQFLRVAFDTASGQTVVPSWQCQSAGCKDHRRFATRASKTCRRGLHHENITIQSISLDGGEGNITGELVHEKHVCFGKPKSQTFCTNLGLVAATEMTDVPFGMEPFDGSVGLGLMALAPSPVFHVLSRFAEAANTTSLGAGNDSQLASAFALYFGQDAGELALGGFNPIRLATKSDSVSAFSWVPVLRPEEGFWQVSIKMIRVGNVSLTCGGFSCRGIIDSFASSIGVPDFMAPKLEAALGIGPRCSGPDMELVLEGRGSEPVVLRLSSDEYGRDIDCRPSLKATNLPHEFENVVILGHPVLQRYYTMFDWASNEVGFGAAASPDGPVTTNDVETISSTDKVEMETLTELEAQTLEEEAIKEEVRYASEMEARRLAEFLRQIMIFQALLVVVIMAFRSTSTPGWRLLVVRLARFGFPGFSKVASSLLAVIPVDPGSTEGLECSICLEVHEAAARGSWSRLRCGHTFHEDCIAQWLQREARCPLCRRDLLSSAPGKTWPL